MQSTNIIYTDDNDHGSDLKYEDEETGGTAKVLQVHAYDWVEKDVYGDDDHVVIHCWALDKESKPNLLRFTDFPAFCYLELPLFVRGRKYAWRSSNIDNFMQLLSARLGDNAPIRYTFRESRKTYYYRSNQKYPMLLLSFNNIRAMNKCAKLMENPFKTDDWGFIKCNVWEDSISIVRKLLTARDTKYSQWFSVTAHLVEPELRISTLEREYIAQWDTITNIPLEECKGWNTYPGVLAFDIEAYSNNHRAFVDKFNALHVAYMISCIYQRYGDPSTRKRYGIVIGDCNHIPPEKLESCVVIQVNDEYDMIEAFDKVIKETDPEVVTGYNILSFDYPYLDHRIKRKLKEWPCMGRILGEKSHMTSKTWKSGAYGHQSINVLHMEGRISIDLLPIVKRDYKLDKYDLNFVCKKFLNKTKHDITAPEMFIIYEEVRSTLKILVDILRQEQNNPDLSKDPNFIKQKDNAKLAFEIAKADTTRVMEYCIQDSELVIELMEKLNIWVGLVQMSNIVGTTIVELFTRGQQVRCLSLIYDLAARKGFVLDKRDTPGFKFAGGFVYEPIPGLYDDVICLDFASLYPSIMMAFNICYTTLVPPELENVIPDSDCHVIEFDQDEIEGSGDDYDDDDEEVLQELTEKHKKEKIVKRHYKFKFYKNQEGLLPFLVRELVSQRRAVNRQIVQTKDELKSLERKEDARAALENYLSGNITIGDIPLLNQRINDLCKSKPPAPPEVITAAKKELAVAELFNVVETEKRLNKAISEKLNPAIIESFKLEVAIAKDYASNNREGLIEKLSDLQKSKAERLTQIENNKLLIIVLDKRQWALKITANSFFGFLGVHTGGKMPLIEGAMSITAKGRELIGQVRKYIENTYGGTQIYGDTDSVMFSLPQIKDSKECNYWGTRLAQEISGIKLGEKDCDGKLWPEGRPGLFLSPLAMEFEKAMRLLCLKKKKYSAYLIGKDGNFKTEDILDRNGNVIGNRLMMLKKGIILARRDNCQFLRKTYTKILDLIMNRGGLDEAIGILVDAIQELLDGKVPHEELIIIRELGANYKSDSFFMKVFADELKKVGKYVNPGDRLDFVIVQDPTATLLGHKMRLSEQYLERLKSPNPELIDYNYYIEKVLMNPINQLFEVGFKDTIPQMEISYRPTNRHKTIYLDRPIKIILKLRERGYDLKLFKDAVASNYAKIKNKQLTSISKSLTLRIINPVPQSTIPQPPITLSPIAPITLSPINLSNIPQSVIIPKSTVDLVTPPTTPTLIYPPMVSKTTPSPKIYPLKLNILSIPK